MNDTNQHAPRILVVANRACPCPTLIDETERRVGNSDSEVLIIAPALNSRLRHWVSDIDEAIARTPPSRARARRAARARHQRER
jgi:hypothetical protein